MSTIDASYASSRDLALLSNIFVPTYTFDSAKSEFQVQLDTYLQGNVNIGTSNTNYGFSINGNPYVQLTLSQWATAPAVATVDMSAYRIVNLGNQTQSDQKYGRPALSFQNDALTGIYSSNLGEVGVLTAGVSGLLVTASGVSNRSNTSNSIGGISLSSGIITASSLFLSGGGLSMTGNLSMGSYLFMAGGITLSGTTISGAGTTINICGAVTTSSGLTTTRITTTEPASANTIGGVNLSSGTISAPNPTADHYIGTVRIQGNNIFGNLTSETIVALSNRYGTSNKGGGIQFFNGKLVVNTSDAVDPIGQFNVSMGNAPDMSAGTTAWSSSYALFGADIASTTGAALGLGYDKTNGVARIVAAQPGSGALKDMVVTARNLSLAVTQLTVCGAIVNPSASPRFIGGVSLTNSLVGGVSISSGGIFTPTASVKNTIGGVGLVSQTISANSIETGTSTDPSKISGVSFSNTSVTAAGNSTIGGVVLNSGRVRPDGKTWVLIGSNSGTPLSQADNTVAVGTDTGVTSQQSNSIAVGYSAGSTNQGVATADGAPPGFAVAIGSEAGKTGQGARAIAIGGSAGSLNQKFGSIAVGNNAASSGQGFRAIAIGDNTARLNQSGGAIAIGTNAGLNTQGGYAIAIGVSAGASTQFSNSIVLNATGADFTVYSTQKNYQNTSGFFVAPIRQDSSTADPTRNEVIVWDAQTKEMFSAKNGSATVGGVAFSGGTITAGVGTSSIVGVTLANNGVTAINITATGTISGGNLVGTTISAGGTSYVGGVTLANNGVTAINITATGTISGGNLVGTTISAGGTSYVGGVTLSNSNVLAQNISAGKLQLSNLTSETTNTNILSLNTTAGAVSYTSKYVQGVTSGGTGITVGGTAQNPTITNTGVTGITAGTGITISPAGPGATGTVTINANTNGTVTSVTSADANITVANPNTTPVLTLSPNLNVTTISAGPGTSYVGGVTLTGGQITATGVLSTIGPLSITSESASLVENTGSGSGGWVSVASSADGQTIFGVRYNGSTIYISRDRGITWVNNTSLTNGFWSTVACSSNGQVVVATQNRGGIGYTSAVFISTNGGVTWGAGTQPGGSVDYLASAVSGDGSTIVVGVTLGGVYRITSADSFTTWTRLDASNNRQWKALAISSNGVTLVERFRDLEVIHTF